MPADAFQEPTRALVRFVSGVGIAVERCNLPEPTFLPGIAIRRGALLIDETRLAYPGDVLHEAGHIAVTTPDKRHGDEFAPDAGEELASIAWSYAALRALGLDPAILFHPAGYKAAAANIVENFGAGRYFGVPLLACWGMTVDPSRHRAGEPAPFPHMLRWLR
jgi:hypothetical protein